MHCLLLGQHQLESAQLSIKLRELNQQFAEVSEEKAWCEAEREKAVIECAEVERQLKVREEEAASHKAELDKLEKNHMKEVAALNREIKQNEKRWVMYMPVSHAISLIVWLLPWGLRFVLHTVLQITYPGFHKFPLCPNTKKSGHSISYN